MSIAIYAPDGGLDLRTSEANEIAFFPDFGAARRAFDSHVASRPSSRTTGHTRDAYNRNLDRFMRWLSSTGSFPDKPAVLRYVAHLIEECRLSSVTVSTALAPVRRWLRELSEQVINPDLEGKEYRTLNELRQNVAHAAAISNPPATMTSSMSPLMEHGNRLELHQIQEMLGTCNRRTLQGKRDYALLLLGFYTGLRRAELQRITLANFDIRPKTDLIRGLRGKRNKTGDIPCPKQVYEAIRDYVDEFNGRLPEGDERRIGNDEPIWRQLSRSGNIPKSRIILGEYGVSRIVSRRHVDYKRLTDPKYDPKQDPKRFACHDMRRTMIYNARLAGMPVDRIKVISRHESLDMVQRYIGVIHDYDDLNLASFFQIG